MIDKEETFLILQQAEHHLRNLRGELNELGRTLDAIRRAF